MWRRFQVAGSVTTARLGYILMTLFEMQASHLFAMELPISDYVREQLQLHYPNGGVREIPEKYRSASQIHRYEIPNEGNLGDSGGDYFICDATAKSSRLIRITDRQGARFNFNYDFGDDWWVSLTLEAVFFDKELNAKELPRALGGEGYGIIEDCGGVSGLEGLAKAFKKKKGREYNEFREWLGIDDLDMSAFDIDDMNFRLKKVPRIYAAIYEQHRAPTKYSIDILDRKYLEKKADA
jgi:hypothetical protein